MHVPTAKQSVELLSRQGYQRTTKKENIYSREILLGVPERSAVQSSTLLSAISVFFPPLEVCSSLFLSDIAINHIKFTKEAKIANFPICSPTWNYIQELVSLFNPLDHNCWILDHSKKRNPEKCSLKFQFVPLFTCPESLHWNLCVLSYHTLVTSPFSEENKVGSEVENSLMSAQ